jgi:cytochrome c-type biogenesis protein
MTGSVGILAAFGAGVLSFLAPCTLALVPGYVSYLAGFTLTEAGSASAGDGDARRAAQRARMAAAVNTFMFALGFTLVFVVLGASLGALSRAAASFETWLNRASGLLIIAMGLMTMGLLRVPFFSQGYGLRVDPARRLRYLGSFLVGAAFAVGWTPCVGPVLGAVFVLAGASGSAGQGALLLFVYALGLMLPFIAAGLVTGWTSWLLRRQGRWLAVANKAAGVLLIALGIALFTGALPILSSWLALGT